MQLKFCIGFVDKFGGHENGKHMQGRYETVLGFTKHGRVKTALKLSAIWNQGLTRTENLIFQATE